MNVSNVEEIGRGGKEAFRVLGLYLRTLRRRGTSDVPEAFHEQLF